MSKLKCFQAFTIALGALAASSSFAAYYDTLPQGVRLFAMRQVNTSNINSSYSKSNNESPYALSQAIGFRTLKDINSVTRVAYQQLKDISPEAADKLTFGEYQANANAKMNVNGFGLAYGVTNHITFYASIPYYEAQTNIEFARTKGNNYNDVKKLVAAGRQNDFNTAYQNLIGQLPDADGALLQSVFVNTYGYKPIGNWVGKGYGDAEIAAMLRLTNIKDRGLALTLGTIAPTGKMEDPDILQDIGFGDGQWDLFAEFGGGIEASNWLQVNSWARYTYQMPFKRTLRAPTDPEFTLSDKKEQFEIKLGDKIDYVLSPTWIMNDWLSFKTEYIFNMQMKSQYSSNNATANEILATNTDSQAHHARAAMSLSSTKLFLKNEFILPASVELSAQTMFAGENTPKYSRYDVEVRFYF